MATNQAPAAALPWRLLVAPVSGWLDIRGRHVLFHALAWQWLLLCMAELVAAPATHVASNSPAESYNAGLRAVGVLVGFIPLTLVLNAAFAALSWLLFRIVGLPRSFSEFLHWTACGMLPFVLGALAGRIILEMLQPPALHQALLAPLQFRGISIGAANWFPAAFRPLEFSWVTFSFLDVFGIWSLVLLALGLRHFLKAGIQESILGSLCLLLLSGGLLTVIWQLFQSLAGPA